MVVIESPLPLHPRTRFTVLAAAVFAFVLVAVSFRIQGRTGLNLADEGWLWQGAMRVLSGDVPVLDFQSYDPARYYWSALFMKLQGGDGILALRRSVALFQACALTVGLLMLRRLVARPAPFVLLALVLLIWFYPRQKLFDLGLSIWAVAVGTKLLERPTVRWHFLAGLFVGLAATFGRHHGAYALLAFSLLAGIAWFRLERSRLLAKLSASIAGIGVGYVPVLLLAATQPGFADAMLASVSPTLRIGTTFWHSVPWPWAADYRVPWPWAIHRFLVGASFVLMPVLYVLGSISVLRKKRSVTNRRDCIFASSICVGSAYLHYAFFRADVNHLAHVIFPCLFALLSAPVVQRHALRGEAALFSALVLLAYSFFSVAMLSPLYLKVIDRNWVEIDVRGDKLQVDPATADAVRTVQSIERNYLRPGDLIVFAPNWPAMYSILRRSAPVWETYSFLPEDLEGQRRFIDELEQAQVQWTVVGDALFDQRRFSESHPRTWRYLADSYEPVDVAGLPRDYRLLRRRSGITAPL